MIKLLNPQRSVTQFDIDSVEQAFGIEFPSELRDLYLQQNGGRPEKNRFVGNKGQCIVHEVLPIRYGKPRLERTIQWLTVERQLIPKDLLPFAVDPGGDFYCVATAGVLHH